MRKLFLFATVAAAGLFAGCSSSDDALSEAGNPAIENVDGDENVPITIGIGNLANMTTRGTGTVGGVGTTSTAAYYVANNWQGQYINVFMFDKDENHQTTLNLTKEKSTDTEGIYENRKMVTPGSAENLITPGYPNATPDATESVDTDGQGEAMNADASIKYYPLQGNFDFFGYHGDDATGAVDNTTSQTQWTVPFTIDGSQDLMTTKAGLNAQDKVTLKGSEDFYSAKAARKGIQPVLTFSHLLTRLQFNLFAGDAETAGYGKNFKLDHYNYKASITDDEYNALAQVQGITATTYFSDAAGHARVSDADLSLDDFAALNPAVQNLCVPSFVNGRDIERAIKVESIQVKSKNTGKMLVAWKDADANATTVSYRMGVITAAAAPSANWTETASQSGKYYWSSQKVVVPAAVYATIPAGDLANYVDYSTLTDPEKSVAVEEKDVPAYKKIVWNTDQENDQTTTKDTWAWLSLKQRASYKKLANAAAIADDDVEGYTAAKTALQTKETAVTTAQATLTEKETALNDAITELEAKETIVGQKETALATAQQAVDQADPSDAGYADLVQARDDAKDDLDAAEAEAATARTARRTAQNDYDAAKTALNNAKKERDAAKVLADQLNPQTIMTETISADVYALLSQDGKDKYEAVTNEMNTNLAPLAPTAADVQDLDYSGATVTFNQKKDAGGNTVGVKIGDALLVAPNKYSDAGVVTGEKLLMKVKLSQKVPTNWNHPLVYEYKSQEFDVEIPLPTKKNTDDVSAFMINNSYNVNLYVYGFSRIKIITVINEWKDGGEIGVGED